MQSKQRPETPNRRDVLKEVGMGVMALPAIVGSVSATADQTTLGRLQITNIEPGWLNNGNWTPAGGQIDSDQAFDVRVDISGIDPSGNTTFVSMAVPGGPQGGLGEPHTERFTSVPSGGGMWYVHTDNLTRAFDPESIFGSWPEGTWQIYVAAFDSSQHAQGTGVSAPFDIR